MYNTESLPGEEWRSVPAWDLYRVSNFGRVMKVAHRGTDGRQMKAKILKQSVSESRNAQGYLVVNLYDSTTKRQTMGYVHRLVALAFIGDPGPDMEVNHMDCDCHNNHVENLEWLDHVSNIHHYLNHNKDAA